MRILFHFMRRSFFGDEIMETRKTGSLLLALLISMLSLSVYADIWLGTGSLSDPNDSRWNVGRNWNTGAPPISGSDVFIDRNTRLQPLVDASVTGAVGGLARLGGTAGGGTINSLTVTGGDITFSNHCILGEGGGSKATLEITGGVFQSKTLWVGNSGNGTVIIRGGSIFMTAESLYVDRFDKTTSVIYLYGGVINQIGNVYMGKGGLIDITEGTLILDGDRRGTVNNYITAGKIKAYSGASTVVVDYDTTNPGKTTVTAVILKKAWKPSPAVGAVIEDLETDLSWMPGSGAVSHTIYFGTNQDAVIAGDPSVLKGTQAELTYDPGLLTAGQTYYWRIDENDGSAIYTGDVWSFVTIDPRQASNPNPANGASGISVNQPVLTWTAGVGAVSHDVYFGESADMLTPASLSQTGTSYTSGNLIKGKQYFWRIDENDGNQTIPGVLWSFTCVSGPSSATWTNNDPNSELWSNELNWNNGTPGTNSDVYIDNDPNVLIDDSVTAVGKVARISITNPAEPNLPSIFMTGGDLNLYEVVLGQNAGSRPVMKISGGTATFTSSIWTGSMSNWNMGVGGRLIVTGGTVNVGTLFVSRSAPPRGALGVQLDGGVINANAISMSQGYMDITDGILIINGNAVNQVVGYISNGWITAFGGTKGISVDFNRTNLGKTTVMVCQKVLQADFYQDCIINLLDFEVLASGWLSDFDNVDLKVLAEEWLQ